LQAELHGTFDNITHVHPSFRSRTLDVLVVPSTPILWIKTPPPLIQPGVKRVPRTQSSLNKRQLGYEMYLSDHLQRSGKPPSVQLLIPTAGHEWKSQHRVLDFLSLLFTWFLYPASSWTYCHTCVIGRPSL
jgi:hypothetical protein